MIIGKEDAIATSLLSKLPVNNGNNTSITNGTTNSSLLCTTLDCTIDSEFLRSILPIMEQIISLPTNQLHPNATTNSLFTSLVALIYVDNLNEDETLRILTNSDILHCQQSLMQQSSLAEYFLEATFAREIQSGTKTIEDFMYYDNYVSLVEFEMDNLKMYAKSVFVSQAVVIGSGPLPITSIEMLKHLSPSAVIINYDHSEEAVELATFVVNKMERIFVENRSALDICACDLNQVDVVYLAALVGIDRMEKKKIVDHLYSVMKPGSILIARTAIGLKTLVYRRMTNELEKFSNVQQFHPKDKKILNSIMCGIR